MVGTGLQVEFLFWYFKDEMADTNGRLKMADIYFQTFQDENGG